MSRRLPSHTQLTLINRIKAGGVLATAPGTLQTSKTVAANVNRLVINGWAAEPGTYPGLVVVTERGQRVADEARDLEDWELREENHLIRVGKRQGPRPAGRNVHCYFEGCERAAKAGPGKVVWFTNESGAPAEKEARIAAARHGMAHLRAAGKVR
jgi:hypothetical protein